MMILIGYYLVVDLGYMMKENDRWVDSCYFEQNRWLICCEAHTDLMALFVSDFVENMLRYQYSLRHDVTDNYYEWVPYQNLIVDK